MTPIHPETYQFRRRNDLFTNTGSTTSTRSTPSTDNKSTSYASPPRGSRHVIEEEKAVVMKSPESYHFQRMYMADGPKKKKVLSFAEPWKSPPESFAMKRGYRPEYKSSHRNSEMKTKSELPKSYQFRRMYRYHMTEQTTDTKKQQQQPVEIDEIKNMDSLGDMYQPLPIESYRFTRLLIPREKVTFSKETTEEQAIRRAHETTIRWNEIEDARYYVPPESYRMNTAYLRAEPKGTYKDHHVMSSTSSKRPIQPMVTSANDRYHDHQQMQSAPSSSSRRQRTTCSCLFFAYHGYCHGNHESETRKYYNVDPESSTGNTIAWREYPNHSNHSSEGGFPKTTASSSSSSSSSSVSGRDKVMYTKVTPSNHQLGEMVGSMLLDIEPRVVGAEAETIRGRVGSVGIRMSKNHRSSSAGRRLSHRRDNQLDNRLKERYRQACGYGGNKAGRGMDVRTEPIVPKTAWDDDYSVCVRGNYGREDYRETLLQTEEDVDGWVYDDYDDDNEDD